MDLLTTQLPAASALAPASMSGELNQPLVQVKVRSACNRCHGQKLRCVRKPGQVSCERCLRLNTSCRFSPRGGGRLPQKPSPEHTYTLRDESLYSSASKLTPNGNPNAMIADGSDICPLSTETSSIAQEQATIHPDLCYPMQGDSNEIQSLHWPGPFWELENPSPLNEVGFADLDITPINESIMLSSLPAPDICESLIRAKDHEADGCLVSSPTSAIRELANINVALYDCSAKLPFMPKDVVPPTTSGQFHSRKTAIFAIDKIFRLTNELINVMKRLSVIDWDTTSAPHSSVDLRQLASQQEGPLVAFTQPQQHQLTIDNAGSGPLPSRSFSHVDEATMFMIISCHRRLMDIYECVFEMMRGCIEHSLTPNMEKHSIIILPQLQVGSHTHTPPQVQVGANMPVSPGTSLMYMLMITMVSSQLCENLVEVIMSGSGGSPESTSGSEFMDSMWAVVIERTNRLAGIIDDISHLLQR